MVIRIILKNHLRFWIFSAQQHVKTNNQKDDVDDSSKNNIKTLEIMKKKLTGNVFRGVGNASEIIKEKTNRKLQKPTKKQLQQQQQQRRLLLECSNKNLQNEDKVKSKDNCDVNDEDYEITKLIEKRNDQSYNINERNNELIIGDKPIVGNKREDRKRKSKNEHQLLNDDQSTTNKKLSDCITNLPFDEQNILTINRNGSLFYCIEDLYYKSFSPLCTCDEYIKLLSCFPLSSRNSIIHHVTLTEKMALDSLKSIKKFNDIKYRLISIGYNDFLQKLLTLLKGIPRTTIAVTEGESETKETITREQDLNDLMNDIRNLKDLTMKTRRQQTPTPTLMTTNETNSLLNEHYSACDSPHPDQEISASSCSPPHTGFEMSEITHLQTSGMTTVTNEIIDRYHLPFKNKHLLSLPAKRIKIIKKRSKNPSIQKNVAIPPVEPPVTSDDDSSLKQLSAIKTQPQFGIYIFGNVSCNIYSNEKCQNQLTATDEPLTSVPTKALKDQFEFYKVNNSKTYQEQYDDHHQSSSQQKDYSLVKQLHDRRNEPSSNTCYCDGDKIDQTSVEQNLNTLDSSQKQHTIALSSSHKQTGVKFLSKPDQYNRHRSSSNRNGQSMKHNSKMANTTLINSKNDLTSICHSNTKTLVSKQFKEKSIGEEQMKSNDNCCHPTNSKTCILNRNLSFKRRILDSYNSDTNDNNETSNSSSVDSKCTNIILNNVEISNTKCSRKNFVSSSPMINVDTIVRSHSGYRSNAKLHRSKTLLFKDNGEHARKNLIEKTITASLKRSNSVPTYHYNNCTSTKSQSSNSVVLATSSNSNLNSLNTSNAITDEPTIKEEPIDITEEAYPMIVDVEENVYDLEMNPINQNIDVERTPYNITHSAPHTPVKTNKISHRAFFTPLSDRQRLTASASTTAISLSSPLPEKQNSHFTDQIHNSLSKISTPYNYILPRTTSARTCNSRRSSNSSLASIGIPTLPPRCPSEYMLHSSTTIDFPNPNQLSKHLPLSIPKTKTAMYDVCCNPSDTPAITTTQLRQTEPLTAGASNHQQHQYSYQTSTHPIWTNQNSCRNTQYSNQSASQQLEYDFYLLPRSTSTVHQQASNVKVSSIQKPTFTSANSVHQSNLKPIPFTRPTVTPQHIAYEAKNLSFTSCSQSTHTT
ncbi:unnamed protein product, partial [Didymodactylos carnosus]